MCRSFADFFLSLLSIPTSCFSSTIFIPIHMNNALLKKMALANWQLVNKLAAKRFQQQETAEEAALFVLDKLSQENWRRLENFSGKSQFTTYFTTVVYRLLEDYSRKRYGRASIPQWIKRLGSFWIKLYRLLCLERFGFHDALHILETQVPTLPPKLIEQAAEEILGRVINCGETHFEQHPNETVLQSHETPYSHTSKAEKETLQQILAHIFFGDVIDEHQHQMLSKLLSVKLELDPAEQLMLKLCYRDGLSQVEAGKILKLNRFQINGRLRRTLAKIKTAFTEAGFSDELRLILKYNDT